MSNSSFIVQHATAALQSLFPGNCFEELVINLNFAHPTCPKAALSRILGAGVTIGSILLFVPQILKIHRAKSAQGISLIAQLLALLGASATAAYSYRSGFIFSQWGDTFFVSIQVAIIILQIFFYSRSYLTAALFLTFIGAAVYGVVQQIVPMDTLVALQAAGIPIVFVSKSIQAWQNYSAQSTGQLSLISVFLQFAGTIARVFTSVQDTGDQLLIVSYSTAAVLNGLIFAQFFLYWNSSSAAQAMKKKKTK